MKHLTRFNESGATFQTLRDIIGDLKDSTQIGYYEIYETTKGCFTNVQLNSGYWNNSLDKEARIASVHRDGDQFVGEVHVKFDRDGRQYWTQIGYAYLTLDTSLPSGIAQNLQRYDVKILSTYPGDERGCMVFNGTFICSGHDGNYLWNINNPKEFKSNTW